MYNNIDSTSTIKRLLNENASSIYSTPQQQHHHQTLRIKLHGRYHELPCHTSLTKKYVLGKLLGSGGYGFVLSAADRLTRQRCAVKFIYKHKIPVTGWVYDPSTTANTTRSSSSSMLVDGMTTSGCIIPTEIYLLQNVHHQNIIQLLDVYQDDSFYYLVMEAHGADWSSSPQCDKSNSTIQTPVTVTPGGGGQDLFECLEQQGHFSESRARHIFTQVLDAVLYLKEKGFYHRDIKDENILIDCDFNIKLIDFGSVFSIKTCKRQQWLSHFHGTLSFASPEILKGQVYQPEPAEVWSLGVLLYTLLYGQVPFSSPLQAIHGHHHTTGIRSSKQCTQLLASIFRKNPKHRPTLEQLQDHPWITMHEP
ncbi:kinase-like domain-containing protein [Absidia repens]|uniref:Kinase-like domain-containing protein n=1 Tax=Absidia repens TaxID=90262 RepID=A0A1X2I0Z2_9FUNG|nr:kinase-like domain-containing protein [Absidia repens]